MKKYIIGICITLMSMGAIASDVGAFILGTIVGSSVYRGPIYTPQIYAPPVIIYQQPPVVYQQLPPVVIYPSQAPYYDPALHGYCSGYEGYLYYQCIENARLNVARRNGSYR